MTKPLADVRLCPCNKTENSLSITARHFTLFWPNTCANDPNPGLGILIMYVFVMYNMCLFIFEEKAEVQDQYPLSLNPVQKAVRIVTEMLGHCVKIESYLNKRNANMFSILITVVPPNLRVSREKLFMTVPLNSRGQNS